MQQLIEDLLLMSKISRTELLKAPVNLNEVIRDVEENLNEEYEDVDIHITSAQLPTIHAISFQIHQLFINLIGNAVKYHRSNQAAIIDIQYRKLKDTDLPPDLQLSEARNYHEISVTDNGIGFNQEYAERIFDPFKRLHTRSDYPGTGLGLSICQRIAENHNGTLRAFGRPDIGSTFILYLPE